MNTATIFLLEIDELNYYYSDITIDYYRIIPIPPTPYYPPPEKLRIRHESVLKQQCILTLIVWSRSEVLKLILSNVLILNYLLTYSLYTSSPTHCYGSFLIVATVVVVLLYSTITLLNSSSNTLIYHHLIRLPPTNLHELLYESKKGL